MPVTAECPNCGKTYQAPDSMAGKQVRCKQCQNVFRIEAPPPAGDEVDLDALAQSFGGDHFGTGDETAVGGPVLDEYGRPSIGRRADVSDISVQDYSGAGGLRANLRYRYPFARQVDVGLPWVMVLLAILVPLRLCLTTTAEFDEPLTTGVGLSRFVILFLAFLVLVFPLTHVMITRAGRDLRFNLPRTPMWRSLACASAVLLLGGSLFVLSGGKLAGLIIGLIVGVTTCVALVTLLFRLLPHEVGKTAGYAAIGAGGGAILASLLIFGINYVGWKASAAQAEPSLFVSPVAIGLPWVEKPVVVAKVPPKPTKPKPTNASSTTKSTDAVATTVQPTPPVIEVAPLSALIPTPLPATPDGSPKLLKSLEITPVDVGFSELLMPLTQSHALGVVRTYPSTSVQCWDVNTWFRPTVGGRNFDRSAGDLAVNTLGDRIVRIVSSPSKRIEQIALGNAMPMQPVSLSEDPRATLEGFVNDHDLIVRSSDAAGAVKLVRRDLSNAGVPSDPQGCLPRRLAKGGRVVRYAPDGSGVLVAYRDESNDAERPWLLGLFAIDKYAAPTVKRKVEWNAEEMEPLGLRMNGVGRAALLLNANNSAYLTFYEFRDLTLDGASTPASAGSIEALNLGSMDALRTPNWNWDNDAICWIDDDTLLVFGKTVVDARTGRTLGEVNLPQVTNAMSIGDGKVLVTHQENGNNALWVATFDHALLAAARKQ